MARLPQPGADDGTWGEILNDYLAVSHNTDGTVRNDAVTSSAIQDDSIAGTKLQDSAVTNSKLAAGTGTNGQVLTKDSLSSGGFKWSTAPAAAPATNSSLGTVQLTNDLGGTATAPTVPGLAAKADSATTITAGAGLTGGGDLSADRTLAVDFGVAAGTAAQGNDSRITGAEQSTNKGLANGYASLNGSALVPPTQLGSGSASSSTFLRGDRNWAPPPVASVAVTTGSETRPNADMVFWIGGTVQPTNMSEGDVWMMEA